MILATTDSRQKFHQQQAVFLCIFPYLNNTFPFVHPPPSLSRPAESGSGVNYLILYLLISRLFLFSFSFFFFHIYKRTPEYITMAEGAQAPPTFKLVLVGDGGTGKASEVEFLVRWVSLISSDVMSYVVANIQPHCLPCPLC